MAVFPADLFDFAFIHNFDQRLDTLAAMAEDEPWDYQGTPSEHHSQFCTTICGTHMLGLQKKTKSNCPRMGSLLYLILA